jgi:anti-anti-sigma factor
MTNAPVVVTRGLGKVIVTIHGRVDRDTVPSIGETIGELADTDAHQVIIDLRDVNFIDTAGLRLLTTASKMFQRQQRDLVLSDPTPPVSRALANCGGPSDLIVLGVETVAPPISSTAGQVG